MYLITRYACGSDTLPNEITTPFDALSRALQWAYTQLKAVNPNETPDIPCYEIHEAGNPHTLRYVAHEFEGTDDESIVLRQFTLRGGIMCDETTYTLGLWKEQHGGNSLKEHYSKHPTAVKYYTDI